MCRGDVSLLSCYFFIVGCENIKTYNIDHKKPHAFLSCVRTLNHNVFTSQQKETWSKKINVQLMVLNVKCVDMPNIWPDPSGEQDTLIQTTMKLHVYYRPQVKLKVYCSLKIGISWKHTFFLSPLCKSNDPEVADTWWEQLSGSTLKCVVLYSRKTRTTPEPSAFYCDV